MVKTRAHLIGLLHAQFCGARSLREIPEFGIKEI
jgi:hypothetical protein